MAEKINLGEKRQRRGGGVEGGASKVNKAEFQREVDNWLAIDGNIKFMESLWDSRSRDFKAHYWQQLKRKVGGDNNIFPKAIARTFKKSKLEKK